MISCATAFVISLDGLLMPFCILFFFSLTLRGFLTMHKPIDGPLLMQLINRSTACFLIPTHTIVSASQGLGNYCIFKCDLHFGSWIFLHERDTQISTTLFKQCCSVKLLVVVSIKKINKVSWSAGPTCGETGFTSWSQTPWGLCRVSLWGALPKMKLMVHEDLEKWNKLACFEV